MAPVARADIYHDYKDVDMPSRILRRSLTNRGNSLRDAVTFRT